MTEIEMKEIAKEIAKTFIISNSQNYTIDENECINIYIRIYNKVLKELKQNENKNLSKEILPKYNSHEQSQILVRIKETKKTASILPKYIPIEKIENKPKILQGQSKSRILPKYEVTEELPQGLELISESIFLSEKVRRRKKEHKLPNGITPFPGIAISSVR